MGKLVIKITRDQLMTWAEDFVKTFDYKERMGDHEHYQTLLFKNRAKLLRLGTRVI